MHRKLYSKIKSIIKPAASSGEKVEIFPDDVFLVSYPKSGNTWMRFLLGNYFINDLDFVSCLSLIPDFHMNPEQCSNVKMRPRFIKSHFAYTPVYPNVVYIVRDGRDVTVSYYYYLQKKEQLAAGAPFGYYFDNFTLKGIPGFGTWSEHVESWLNRSKDVRLLLIKYEEMLCDPGSALAKVLRFSGIEADWGRIRGAVEKSTFERMRKLEQQQQSEYFDKNGGNNKKFRFMRKGVAGDWRLHFSRENEESFMKQHGKTLKSLGYCESASPARMPLCTNHRH
jgi:hypothetical protein